MKKIIMALLLTTATSHAQWAGFPASTTSTNYDDWGHYLESNSILEQFSAAINERWDVIEDFYQITNNFEYVYSATVGLPGGETTILVTNDWGAVTVGTNSFYVPFVVSSLDAFFSNVFELADSGFVATNMFNTNGLIDSYRTNDIQPTVWSTTNRPTTLPMFTRSNIGYHLGLNEYSGVLSTDVWGFVTSTEFELYDQENITDAVTILGEIYYATNRYYYADGFPDDLSWKDGFGYFSGGNDKFTLQYYNLGILGETVAEMTKVGTNYIMSDSLVTTYTNNEGFASANWSPGSGTTWATNWAYRKYFDFSTYDSVANTYGYRLTNVFPTIEYTAAGTNVGLSVQFVLGGLVFDSPTNYQSTSSTQVTVTVNSDTTTLDHQWHSITNVRMIGESPNQDDRFQIAYTNYTPVINLDLEPDDGARESFYGGWNAKRIDDLKSIIDALSWTRYQYGGSFVTNWVDSADTTNGHVVGYGPVSGFGNEAYHDVYDGSTLGFTQTNWANAQTAAEGDYSTNAASPALYPRAHNLSRGEVSNALFSAELEGEQFVARVQQYPTNISHEMEIYIIGNIPAKAAVTNTEWTGSYQPEGMTRLSSFASGNPSIRESGTVGSTNLPSWTAEPTTNNPTFKGYRLFADGDILFKWNTTNGLVYK